jgi:hypothetical protein
VAAVNAARIPDKSKGKTWAQSLDPAVYSITANPDSVSIAPSFGNRFPHKLDGADANFYTLFTRTPFANEYVFETAREAIRAKKMGQDAIPDILTVNLSTNDYVGHAFGPDSPEVMEISVQTDRALSNFFRFLDKTVTGGIDNVLIVVTADHGVCPIAEELAKKGLPGGRMDPAKFQNDLRAATQKEFGVEGLISYVDDSGLYIDASKADADFDDITLFIRDYLRDMPEIFTAYTRWELEEQMLPAGDVSRMLARSYHRQNSGDVFFFLRPGYRLDSYKTGTGHGSPWAYDTSVPLLMHGRWIDPGKYTIQCGPEDIAPTVCAALGVLPPSGCVGRAIGIKK